MHYAHELHEMMEEANKNYFMHYIKKILWFLNFRLYLIYPAQQSGIGQYDKINTEKQIEKSEQKTDVLDTLPCSHKETRLNVNKKKSQPSGT